MAFCRNCGAEVTGRYCARCGTPAEGSGVADRGPSRLPPSGGMPENVAAALCYVLGFITGILFLVLPPYNRNRLIRFHAFQSIFLHVGSFVIWMLAAVLSHGAGIVLEPLIGIGLFVLWVYVIVKAYQGQKIVLPLVGPLAEQQA